MAEPAEIQAAVEAGIPFQGTNLWVLVFAILVASVGLNVNSTAVIIGAMLISPLMGPIVGIGFGAATLELGLIRRGFRSLFTATLISLTISTLYFRFTPLTDAGSELLARTYHTGAQPTPGLAYATNNDRIAMRGIGRFTNNRSSEGGVAMYSDGFYTSSVTAFAQSTLFIERTEALRGPQGTLYGRN
ncbi:MAG: DUF389 domain-containing protein, partial [Hymenobacter sp.]